MANVMLSRMRAAGQSSSGVPPLTCQLQGHLGIGAKRNQLFSAVEMLLEAPGTRSRCECCAVNYRPTRRETPIRYKSSGYASN